ncbi:hypothetical protein NL676_011722 [Syzygium grande]|nr:hypothetical protein NL676_011722 [Syzygium grande]
MIHAQTIKMPGKWSSDDHLVKILIRHYVNFGDHRSAALALLLGLARSNVGWNSFSEELKDFRELPVQILEVFDDLRCKGMVFDARIFTVALRVCTCVLDLWLGVLIHACVIKTSLDSDAHLQRALMNFYERCWGMERANQVFNEMPKREDVVWNEAVKLNMKQGQWIRALELFRDMQYTCMKVKCTTTVRVLQACGKLKVLPQGKQIHAHVLRFGMESSVPICNVLISMYAKNGELELAGAVFNSMEDHNLTSWNSIIYAYASFGFLNDAWSHFHKLESSTIEPDIITWNCLLSGHTLNGSYEDVLTILCMMQTSGIQPNSSSITCDLQTPFFILFFTETPSRTLLCLRPTTRAANSDDRHWAHALTADRPYGALILPPATTTVAGSPLDDRQTAATKWPIPSANSGMKIAFPGRPWLNELPR